MTMRRLICALAMMSMAVTAVRAVEPPDEKKAIGTQMPDVALVADDSTTFKLSALWGKPVIVSPIFTSCPNTCSMITESLRDALHDVGEPGVGYEVLTISFDPADDTAAMRAYRERLALPKGWRLATMNAADLAAFLGAMDFHVDALDGGGFAHPNLIVVLGPDLRVRRYLHGVMFESAEVLASLEGAAKDTSLVRRFRPVILIVVAMGVVAVSCALYATRRREEEAS
jgi:protein SCO1/2